MRHQAVKRAWPGLNRKQNRNAVAGHESADEESHSHGRCQPDNKTIAPEHRRQAVRPGIAGIGLRPQLGKYVRHIDGEFGGWGILALVVTCAAMMTKVGEVIETPGCEAAPPLHRWEDRAQALTIAAGVTDRHLPVGFGVCASCAHS